MRRHGWPCPILLLFLATVAGCTGLRSVQVPVDERFGHRYDDPSAGGRHTVLITPPDSAMEYFYYPAPFDTVHVRPAPFREGIDPATQQLPVEVLVKGSFPDACSELDDLQLNRAAHIIEGTLTIRRPRGAVCASVLRPYRFYFMLDGLYGPGHYTMKLNNEIIPFQVTVPK